MPALRLAASDAGVRLRSLLFVPGDRPERMHKALGLAADALILDLEDAVAPERKPEARQAVARFLRNADRSMRLFVRINPLDSGLAQDDLAAVLDARPDGIVLPKSESEPKVPKLGLRAGAPAYPVCSDGAGPMPGSAPSPSPPPAVTWRDSLPPKLFEWGSPAWDP